VPGSSRNRRPRIASSQPERAMLESWRRRNNGSEGTKPEYAGFSTAYPYACPKELRHLTRVDLLDGLLRLFVAGISTVQYGETLLGGARFKASRFRRTLVGAPVAQICATVTLDLLASFLAFSGELRFNLFEPLVLSETLDFCLLALRVGLDEKTLCLDVNSKGGILQSTEERCTMDEEIVARRTEKHGRRDGLPMPKEPGGSALF